MSFNSRIKIYKSLTKYLIWVSLAIPVTAYAELEQKWTRLLDIELSNFDKFLGVPHYSVDLDGYEKGDGKSGKPIGLNKDPLNVFSTIETEDDVVLKISGEVFGGLSTKQEYQNYHLRAEFKWGENKFEPRLNLLRDNGILYHCTGEYGAFWNVWMRAPEMQVQETDMGDFYALAGVAMDIRSRKSGRADARGLWAQIYDPSAAIQTIGNVPGAEGRCRRILDLERSHGEWNSLELICFEDTAVHVVNGQVVMVLRNSRVVNQSGETLQSLQRGKIQFQSEGAEAYYRRIQIMPIESIPDRFKAKVKADADPSR